jgi:hypothetical protein
MPVAVAVTVAIHEVAGVKLNHAPGKSVSVPGAQARIVTEGLS